MLALMSMKIAKSVPYCNVHQVHGNLHQTATNNNDYDKCEAENEEICKSKNGNNKESKLESLMQLLNLKSSHSKPSQKQDETLSTVKKLKEKHSTKSFDLLQSPETLLSSEWQAPEWFLSTDWLSITADITEELGEDMWSGRFLRGDWWKAGRVEDGVTFHPGVTFQNPETKFAFQDREHNQHKPHEEKGTTQNRPHQHKGSIQNRSHQNGSRSRHRSHRWDLHGDIEFEPWTDEEASTVSRPKLIPLGHAVQPIASTNTQGNTKGYEKTLMLGGPAVLVYDLEAVTREEDDPASAVLYFRPRHTGTNARTALAGQLAGVLHFCRGTFSTPTTLKTKHAHLAIKDYQRFVVMVCGPNVTWAQARLQSLTRLLDASTGGLQHMAATNAGPIPFTDKLERLLDNLLPQAIPDANFNDDHQLSSSSQHSPAKEVKPELFFTDVRRRDTATDRYLRKESDEDQNLEKLHQVFSAVPSLQLPNSSGCVFLKAQQVVEACQQHQGVIAGSTAHSNRVLSSQLDEDLDHIVSGLRLQDHEECHTLEKRKVNFQLPNGVKLLQVHVSRHTHNTLKSAMPKIIPRRSDRSGGIRSEATSRDLSSLRSVLNSRQSLHNYPSTLPVNGTNHQAPGGSSLQTQPQQAPHGPSLIARISGCGDLDSRPSQSLPGSPRKIRVAAMLPDVGNHSPDLRYKVLTGLRPRPPASAHSSPKRLPGGRNGITRGHDNGGLPGQTRLPGYGRYSVDKRNSIPNNKLLNNDDSPARIKNGIFAKYDSEKNESGFEDGVLSDNELNIKNTKNRLNLKFAPEEISRPSDIDLESINNDEPKISREINGNISKDSDSNGKCSPNGNNKCFNSNISDLKDEDDSHDTSRSEDSEISVLDVSTMMESKENGDRKLAEAVKGLMELTRHSDDPDTDDSGQAENHLTESGQHEVNKSAEGWELLTLYTQKYSDMSLNLLLAPNACSNSDLIYSLWRIGSGGLAEVQSSVERALELSESSDGGDAFLQWSYNLLTTTTQEDLDPELISVAHHSFAKNQDLMEVTLRSGESVLWGHRSSRTETFYQAAAAPRPGLPIPSDAMAKVAHRARRRLERDYAITLL